MRLIQSIVVCLFALSASAESIAFVNGRWFDGAKFVDGTRYAVDGVFVARKPARIDRTVDLEHRWIVPPYGEAHNHNIADSKRFDSLVARYLADGVFYVKNPNSLPRLTTPLAGRINVPSSIDVAFANGGITSSDGHPIDIVSPNRGFKDGDGEGAFYYAVDSAEDLDRKWPALLASHPDFVKAYLLFSENYAARREKPENRGWNGLDPQLLPEIVRRAHAAGLRVSTHIETAADFRTAVAAGVDEINHLPGFRPEHDDLLQYVDGARYRINAADARAAAKRKIVVVTTIAGVAAALAKPEVSGEAREAALAVITGNLRLLRDAGVKIAVGSDSYGDTSRAEMSALRGLGVFSNRELLEMWTTNTAATIFPKRRLGHLEAGYEASFLALDGDPLADSANLSRIGLRVKSGVVLGSG